MSTYDAGYDEVKKNQYVNSEAITTTQTGTTQAAPQTKSVPNTVFDPKTAEENAKKFGLTTEEYLAIVNNPEFAGLSPEEQINYINRKKAELKSASAPNVTGTPETTEAITEHKSITDIKTQLTTEVRSAEIIESTFREDLPNDSKPQKEKPATFDSNAYCNMEDYGDKLKIYTEEYAKNQFMFGNLNDIKTEDDWNKLNKKDREQLIKNAENIVVEDLEIRKNIWGKKTGLDEKSILLEEKMRALQTANTNKISLNTFHTYSRDYQSKMVNDYLEKIKTEDPSKLSFRDEAVLCWYDTKFDSLKAALKEHGIQTDESLTLDKAVEIARKNEISVGEALKTYLEKQNPEELDDHQRHALEFLKKSTTEYLHEFGTLDSSEDKLYQDLLVKYRNDVKDAQSSIVEINIITDKIFEDYKDKPEEIMKLFSEAVKTGNTELLAALYAKADSCKGFQNMLADSNNWDHIVLNSGNTGDLGEEGAEKATEKLSQFKQQCEGSITGVGRYTGSLLGSVLPEKFRNNKNIKNIINKLSNNSARSCSDSQLNNKKITDNLTSAGAGKTLADISHEDKFKNNLKVQLNINDSVARCGSKEDKKYGATSAYLLNADIQTRVIDAYTENEPEVTEAVIEDGTVTRLASKNQVSSFELLQKRTEEQFPKDTAIEYGKKLNDQIADCDVKNQLAMHKISLSSKYSEVQEHAASNVPKLDKSVQADAIKAVYETGNTKAIEAVNTQLSKCDAAAVKSVEKEITLQIAAMEERHTQEVTSNIARNLVSMEAAKDPTASEKWAVETRQEKLAYYREMFIKSTPLEKFRMISKLQGVWQKEVITHIATYCPELLSSLISSMGADLFQLQLSPEIRNKIMLEMLQVPDMQTDALEYFKDNPNGFGSSVKATCAELLVERGDAIAESQTIKNALPRGYLTEPDNLTSGGKVSNREYYGSNEDLSFWKRDKLGNLLG